MFRLLTISCLHFFVTFSYSSPLPDERNACKTEEILFIPNEYDYYEEPVELSFDSGMSLNHILVSRILEEECGLRDKEFPLLGRREKRSAMAKGIYRLSKYFLHFYQKSKKILKPELLKEITKVVDKLRHIKSPIGKTKFSGIGKFFYQVWKDVNEVRKESKDEHFDEMLEHTLRTSLQLLIHNGELSEMILNHPIILSKIKKRISIDNAILLSTVSATNVMCHQFHRDSQVVIFLKLKIPKIGKTIVEKCDDIGTIKDNTYQYYELPTATFAKNGHFFKVDIKKCVFENFVFCPFDSIRPTYCSKEKLERCQLRIEAEPKNFVRELQSGFAVYGDFTQVITTRNELQSLWTVRPRLLYHIIPQSNEVVLIGDNELRQTTQSEETIIRQVE